MKILFAKGNSQYGALRDYADLLIQKMKEDKHEVVVVDRAVPGEWEKVTDIVDESFDIVFSLQAVAYKVKCKLDECGKKYDDITYVCVCGDHPIYVDYWLKKMKDHKKTVFIVSDDNQYNYLKKYYPQIHSDLFLPLAGTSLYPDGSYPSFEDRTYDVVFTGNFTPKEEFDQYIDRLGEEYAVFYRSMLTELIQNPQLADDAVMEAHLHREFPDASNEEIRKTIANMIFIDAYIRFYFREKIIKTLVDHKINVHCVGKGWNRLQCKSPEYLTFEEGQLSKGCLERIANTKISLNIMPWFKDGAHDRVFNSMANGAVCVTDTSRYLCCELTDRENVIFYDLSNIEALPDLVNSILQNPKKAKKIARNAYTLTMRKHTWANRANDLLRFIHTLS